MNNLMSFENYDVEVFEFEGKVLFNPRHVGEILGINDSSTISKHIREMNDNKKLKLKNSDWVSNPLRKLNNAGETFITESGVYDLIFKSRKSNAIKFKDWVTDEVLPSIRKHGTYMTDEIIEKTLTDPDFIIGLATKLKEEQLKRKELENKIIEQQPLVTFAERCMKSKDNILVRELSKIIQEEGICNIGEKKLYQQLRDWGLILKGKTEPSQKAMDMGLFVVEQRVIKTAYGEKMSRLCKVTPKGQVHIVERVASNEK